MAIGFQIYYKRDVWYDISNPSFVFTSPNMDQGISAGTRSHIVAGECSVGIWIEDESRNKMYKIACAQDESYTYPTTVHQYNYDDYRAPRVKVATKVTTPFSKIYLSERPTTVSGNWYPNPTVSGNKFEATKITPAVDNWWKLNETIAGPYVDSVGSFGLVSSGGVVPVYYPSFEFYAPEFNGDNNSLIYSYNMIGLDDDFCFSFCVDSYGPTSSGIDDFGYNSTFLNVVNSGTNTYFCIGCSETNTITYSIKTSVSTYKSDTGVALTSGVFSHITGSYDQNNGFYLYRDNILLAHNVSVSGTVGSGNLCIGNTAFGYSSTFKGTISDIKYWDTCLDSDFVNEIPIVNNLDAYPICMFGSSVGDYVVDVSPSPVEINKGLFYGLPTYKEDSHFSDTLHLFMKFGEAYNCYITAWDDSTHSSILNTALSNELCKLSACVWRSPDVNTDTWPDNDQQSTTIPHVYDYVSDFPIKGNELFYGKFNLVYYVREPNIVGDIVSVRPRISTVNSLIFSPGNYDFVITFHYQYT